MLERDELVENLGRDRVVSMRRRVLGGSWVFAARVLADQKHVLLCPLGQRQATVVLLGRRVNKGFQEMWQVGVPVRGAPYPQTSPAPSPPLSLVLTRWYNSFAH